jgi:hypothetical protein
MSHDANFFPRPPQGDHDQGKVRQMLSDVLPAYALGAASEEEVRFVAEALPLHPEAAEELVEYYALLDAIVASVPPPEGAPPPVSALMARIGAEGRTDDRRGRMYPAQRAQPNEINSHTDGRGTPRPARRPSPVVGTTPASSAHEQPHPVPLPVRRGVGAEARKSSKRGEVSARPWGAYALVAMALLAFGVSNIYWAWELNRVRSDTQSLISGQQQAIAQLQLTLTPAPTQSLAPPQVLTSQHRNLTPTTTLDGMQGIFVWSADERIGTLYVEGMPPLEEGRAYQLWLMRDEGTVAASLGVFTVDPEGAATLVFESGEPINSYQDIGISIEPLGGSPTPTTPNVAVASI